MEAEASGCVLEVGEQLLGRLADSAWIRGAHHVGRVGGRVRLQVTQLVGEGGADQVAAAC